MLSAHQDLRGRQFKREPALICMIKTNKTICSNICTSSAIIKVLLNSYLSHIKLSWCQLVLISIASLASVCGDQHPPVNVAPSYFDVKIWSSNSLNNKCNSKYLQPISTSSGDTCITDLSAGARMIGSSLVFAHARMTLYNNNTVHSFSPGEPTFG